MSNTIKVTPQITTSFTMPKLIAPAALVSEKTAKEWVAKLQEGDSDWTYSTTCVNMERGLWEVRWTDETGYSERVSF
jgi:hypothetical protein